MVLHRPVECTAFIGSWAFFPEVVLAMLSPVVYCTLQEVQCIGLFRKPDPATGHPLYLQLIQQIRHAIETGALQDSAQLPSIRALAEELVVSPNTIVKAYSELAHDGVLELRQGAGAFICVKRRTRSLTEQVQASRRQIRNVIEALRENGLLDEEIRRAFDAEMAAIVETMGRR